MIWLVIQFSLTFSLSPEEFKAFYQSKSEKQKIFEYRFPIQQFVQAINKVDFSNNHQNTFLSQSSPIRQPTLTHFDNTPSHQTHFSTNMFPVQPTGQDFKPDISKLAQGEKSLVKILNMYKQLKNLNTSLTMKPTVDHRFTIKPDYIRDTFNLQDSSGSQASQRPNWTLFGFRKGRKQKSTIEASTEPNNQSIIFSTRIQAGIEVNEDESEMKSNISNSSLLQKDQPSFNRPKRFSIDENLLKRVVYYEPKARRCSTQEGYEGKCLPTHVCYKTNGTPEHSRDCGFHTCCVNIINTCGLATIYNNTVWRKPEGEFGGSCTLKIVKQSYLICQIRLDFKEFVLKGPTNGSCRNDILLVNGQNVNSVIPQLCGKATGDHLYIDVDNATSPIELKIINIGEFERNWDIIVSQIECANPYKPPRNCLQYYTNTSGTFGSFNRNATERQYLNNLNYAICLRKPTGFCSIQYEITENQIFNFTNIDGGITTVASGNAGVGPIDCPDDYIVIGGNKLCGTRFNDGSEPAMSENTKIIDSTNGPFIIQVRTNEDNVGEGFELAYQQLPCS